MSVSFADREERSYQIGTVSTLTGLDPHTIRAWERRHSAIKPSRTETGRRRYDDQAVERLQLLKALVDCHEAIGVIANLSDQELRERIEKLAALGGGPYGATKDELEPERQRRMALLAPSLHAQLAANAIAFPEFDVSVSADGSEELLAAIRRDPCGTIVLELDALGLNPLAFVQACRGVSGFPTIFVLYRFARRSLLAQLAREGAKLVQVPLRAEQLRRTMLDQIMIDRARAKSIPAVGRVAPSVKPGEPQRAQDSPRRFDDRQLARLFEISTSVECECPNHLSSLISALVAFESYSQSCESRDEADERLHRRLAEGTGQARASLETLLSELCEHEGIRV